MSDLELPGGVYSVVLFFNCLHKHVSILSDLIRGPILSRLLLKGEKGEGRGRGRGQNRAREERGRGEGDEKIERERQW